MNHFDLEQFSIRVYKQNFNFACSHFLIFEDGTREPLHGHNYRVEVCGEAPKLKGDMVFDFLNIKPLIREICAHLDHKLLLPAENLTLKRREEGANIVLETPDGSTFSVPKTDLLLLPISNTSAERLAMYIAVELNQLLHKRFQFSFSRLKVDVEETPGQSAGYVFHQ